jgi:3-oxoacyl-[acyl-carrier protein] reductase
MQSPQPLQGRVALVTGCSRRIGIGFAIASRLAALGADLFLQAYAPYDADQPWGVDLDGVPALAAELRQSGQRVDYLQADFSDPAAPEQVIEAARRVFGHLDIPPQLPKSARSPPLTRFQNRACKISLHTAPRLCGSCQGYL